MIDERRAAWASIGVVIVVVVIGLWLSGSPGDVRAERLDAQRVSDLRRLSVSLQLHWQMHAQLPEALSDLVDGRRLSQLPVDPETDAAYQYRRITEERFQLCAMFARSSADDTADDNFWRHDAGRECFEFDFSTEPVAPR